MKKTIADNIQLFNVKALASSGLTAGEIPENETGIIDVSTGLTISGTTPFASLPETITIVSKLNGKVYYLFNEVNKNQIQNVTKTEKSDGKPNIWKTTIKNCGCLKDVLLNININDAELMQRDGLTWTHRDVVYELSTEEMACNCRIEGSNEIHDNNMITMLLHKKMESNKSQFYKSYVGVDTESLETGTDLPSTDEEEGDLFLKTGADEGLYLYMNGNWELIGDVEGIIEDVEGYVEFMKSLGYEEGIGVFLDLYLEGYVKPMPDYNDLEVNYIYPRGTQLKPGITVRNQGTPVKFVEVQPLEYDEGAGYDLRSLEWDYMNYYTDLNFKPQICGGIAHKKLKYQFENQTRYDVVSLEFHAEKTVKNSGETMLLGIVFGSEDSTVATNLYNMFNG